MRKLRRRFDKKKRKRKERAMYKKERVNLACNNLTNLTSTYDYFYICKMESERIYKRRV